VAVDVVACVVVAVVVNVDVTVDGVAGVEVDSAQEPRIKPATNRIINVKR